MRVREGERERGRGWKGRAREGRWRERHTCTDIYCGAGRSVDSRLQDVAGDSPP